MITLDGRAQQRLLVITNVLADELTVEEAAVFPGISTRQMRRVLAAYRAEGPGALVHGNRERSPANRLPDAHRRRLAELARTTYAGFNAEHLATADRVLARYPMRHDVCFGVPPAIGEPAWRLWSSPWPVEAVLCFHYPRRVANDATIPTRGLARPPRRTRATTDIAIDAAGTRSPLATWHLATTPVTKSLEGGSSVPVIVDRSVRSYAP